ncbi:MAG: hypothetical protein ABF811_09510 [Pseudoclavibacter sp.]
MMTTSSSGTAPGAVSGASLIESSLSRIEQLPIEQRAVDYDRLLVELSHRLQDVRGQQPLGR